MGQDSRFVDERRSDATLYIRTTTTCQIQRGGNAQKEFDIQQLLHI